MTTVITRVREAHLPEILFTEKSLRYRVADVEAYERSLMAAGFEKHAALLKREEEAKLAKTAKADIERIETEGRAKTSFARGSY